jgi:hypothetical protein
VPRGGERHEQHRHASASAEPDQQRECRESEEPERVF